MSKAESVCRICLGPLSKDASYRFTTEHACHLTSNGKTLITIMDVPAINVQGLYHCKACYRQLMAIQKAEKDLSDRKESLKRDFHRATEFFSESMQVTATVKRRREPSTPRQTTGTAKLPSSATRSPMQSARKLM